MWVVSFKLRALSPREIATSTTEKESRWVLAIVWTLQRREKLLVPAENKKYSSATSVQTTATE